MSLGEKLPQFVASGDGMKHRLAIGRKFSSRIAAGDAVFLSGAVAGVGSPCTVSDGEVRPISGMNRLMLMQVMKDRAWDDPRFFTLAQIQGAGWGLQSGAGAVNLQFLVSKEADGKALDVPSVRQFSVFNASEIDGVTPFPQGALGASLEHLTVAAQRAGFSSDVLGGVREAACCWLLSLQAEGDFSPVDKALRGQLAACLLEAQAGLPVGAYIRDGLCSRWAKGINDDPLSLFRALKDAETLSAHVLNQARAVETEFAVSNELARSRGAVVSARVEKMFSEREAVLAVPFAEKDRAKALGAMWYGPRALWFVPKGADVAAFKEWNVGVNCLNAVASENLMLDDFQKAMANMGLDTSKSPEPDGKWHNVAVDSYKGGKNKSGSYILSLNGGRDGGAVGTILNKHSGEKFFWRFQGEALTPEQRAKTRAEALAREALAEAEAVKVQDVAAAHAGEIWSCGLPANGHEYVVRKGICPDGLKQVSGNVLLQYPEFKGDSGASIIRADEDYLIVPMSNSAGELRAVQAISQDGAVKTFMRGAQKKGTMLVLGASSFDSLENLESGEVAYVEGVATGASFHEAFGGPVVVCFDAGNLEFVVAQTFPKLSNGVSCVLAVDNDQFHVERSLGFLADKLGVNPYVSGGASLAVGCGISTKRQVGLGDVVANGEWQQAPRGTYCMTVTHDGEAGAVRSVAVEVVPDNGDRKMRAVFENRGVEAGLEAKRAIDSSRTIMVMPEFKSLAGRPTDWNDLAAGEGVDAIRSILLASGRKLREQPVDILKDTSLKISSQNSISRAAISR